MVQLQRNQKQEEELKLLNDLKLQFEKELWALNQELAGHTLSDEQLSDLGLHQDNRPAPEETEGKRCRDQGAKLQETGEENPLQDQQHQTERQAGGRIQETVEAAEEQYQPGRTSINSDIAQDDGGVARSKGNYERNQGTAAENREGL